MRWINGGVTAPVGFVASGVSAGIKQGRKLDLALVVSEQPAAAAATLTTNRVTAAPVEISRERVRRGVARAVLINSGCANCLTGPQGVADALRLGRRVADALGASERQILLASTGLIGSRLPVEKIERAIPRLVQGLHPAHHRQAARAILTTDTMPKEAAVDLRIGGRRVRVGGMAKGVGMIAPNLATMLGVITTDALVAPGLLRVWLRRVCERTFNRVTVDGDMSTNDTVFALASGRSGAAIRFGSRDERLFAGMLEAVAGRLATLIVKDGEGATRLADIRVRGARSDREAQACARHVANSPLVKTMLAGGDPNVGRIAAAIGASAARFDPERLEIAIGAQQVVAGGAIVRRGISLTRTLLKPPEVTILIHLHAGRGQGRMLTCDLSEEYVRINARYST